MKFTLKSILRLLFFFIFHKNKRLFLSIIELKMMNLSSYKIKISIHMWLVLIVSFVVILSLWFYYSFYYKPRKVLNWYKDTLEGLGYKVYSHGFLPLNSSFIQSMLKH